MGKLSISCVCVCVCVRERERFKVLIDCTPFIVIIKYWLHSLCYTIGSCSLLFYTEWFVSLAFCYHVSFVIV